MSGLVDDGEEVSLLGSKNLKETAGKYYVTTAINYANGSPHMGHAYEAILTDAVARYHRLSGKNTRFLTGADEHGQKIMNTAERAGVSPQALVDKCVEEFKKLDADLDISYDRYLRTTDAEHEDECRKLWVLCEKDITLERYEGWYDERAEAFVKQSDAELQGFKDPDGIPLKRTTEECYFFALGKYSEAIRTHVLENPEFVQPSSRRADVLKMLEEPLEKLAISRTTFDWGVALPPEYAQGHVMYVWFDALTNYLTGATEGMWPADCHVIGKDIVRFHAIYWPAMLLSAGLDLPRSVFCHGFVLDAAGAKMSKTLGNVVSPRDVLPKFGSDSFRYFCYQATPGADLKFSETSLVLSRNGELADGFGNLVHRAVALVVANFGGLVPEAGGGEDVPKPFDIGELQTSCREAMAAFDVFKYAKIVMAACRATNKWLADLKPWDKKKPCPYDKASVLRLLLESVYILSLFLAPLIPRAATKALYRVGGVEAKSTESLTWSNLETGAKLTPGPPLFEQIVIEDHASKLKKEKKAAAPKKEEFVDYGSTEDTAASRLSLVVGKIVEVWEHPDSDKLFCERIDVGGGEIREIGSGLRKHYAKEELQDRRVLVVTNLKPRKLGGFPSKGMVLCATSDDLVVCVDPPQGAALGDRVALDGLDNPAASEKQCDKLKLFALAQPHFTVKDKVCYYKDKPFKINGDNCTAQVPDGLGIS